MSSICLMKDTHFIWCHISLWGLCFTLPHFPVSVLKYSLKWVLNLTYYWGQSGKTVGVCWSNCFSISICESNSLGLEIYFSLVSSTKLWNPLVMLFKKKKSHLLWHCHHTGKNHAAALEKMWGFSLLLSFFVSNIQSVGMPHINPYADTMLPVDALNFSISV